MISVDRLLAEYIEEHRSGGDADPRAYLARASPQTRSELAALIDAFLVRAPRRPLDDQGFRGSTAERTVDELHRAIAGQSGLWPAVLPELRDRAGVKRSDLVERLAGLLGVANRTDKVARYYHEMEQGLLPSQGVSNRVLEALSQIVGESTQALRDAGRSLGAPPLGEPVTGQAAFARRAAYAEAAAAPPAATSAGDEEWDEADELFQGG